MILLIYLSGVIVMMVLSAFHLRQDHSVYLSDIFQCVVFTILSWTALLFVAHTKLYDWMVAENHDKLLWHNDED